MEEIAFVIVYFLAPIPAIQLLRSADIHLLRYSIQSFFIVFYFVFAYVGLILIYFELDRDRVLLGIVDKNIIAWMLVYSLLTLYSLIGGFIFARHGLRLTPNEKTSWVFVQSNEKQNLAILTLFLVCVGVFGAYMFSIDQSALVVSQSGDALDTAVARSKMGTLFPNYWRYEIFFRTILDYCVAYIFAQYIATRSGRALIAFVLSFSVAVVTAIVALEKGPLIKLLLALYVVGVAMGSGRYWEASYKRYLFLCAGLVIGYMLFAAGSDLCETVTYAIVRTISGQIAPSYVYLKLFPNELGYLYGKTMPNPGGVFPYAVFPLTQHIDTHLNPQLVGTGLVGSAPTVFWAEVYANWGPLAIPVVGFLVGVALFVISHVLVQLGSSPASMALTAALTLHYRDLSGTGISSYLVDIKLAVLALITGFLISLGWPESNGQRQLS